MTLEKNLQYSNSYGLLKKKLSELKLFWKGDWKKKLYQLFFFLCFYFEFWLFIRIDQKPEEHFQYFPIGFQKFILGSQKGLFQLDYKNSICEL